MFDVSAFVGVFTNKMESDLLVKTPTKAKKITKTNDVIVRNRFRVPNSPFEGGGQGGCPSQLHFSQKY
jgi:hypothetical protein